MQQDNIFSRFVSDNSNEECSVSFCYKVIEKNGRSESFAVEYKDKRSAIRTLLENENVAFHMFETLTQNTESSVIMNFQGNNVQNLINS